MSKQRLSYIQMTLFSKRPTFEVARDGCWQHFSAGQKIEMRLVHIFEMRDGKISKEIVFDMGRPV